MYSSRLASIANTALKEQAVSYIPEENSVPSYVAEKKAIIKRDIKKAIENHDIKVFYQSIHSSENGKIIGAEALARWEHIELGMLYPKDFVPAFEEDGCVKLLDAYIREQVCIDIKRWKDKYYNIVPISVNLSRIDFEDVKLVDSILSVVNKYGVKPSEICFEITETATIDNTDKIICAVNRLRDYGFIIELDDFGSGYSSLTILNKLSLNTLKIDKEMIAHIDNDKDRYIVDTCIKLGQRFNLTTAAEGVETREQFEILRALKCDMLQGYYFSRPVPSNIFENRLI